jgi:hypothetical protein
MEIALGHINVNNICPKFSIEYGNKICNEFRNARTKEWRPLSLDEHNYVYGKDDVNNIQKNI